MPRENKYPTKQNSHLKKIDTKETASPPKQPTFRLATELPFRLEMTDSTNVQKNLTTRKLTIPQTPGEQQSKGCLAYRKQLGTNNRNKNAFAAVTFTSSNSSYK